MYRDKALYLLTLQCCVFDCYIITLLHINAPYTQLNNGQPLLACKLHSSFHPIFHNRPIHRKQKFFIFYSLIQANIDQSSISTENPPKFLK